MTDVPNTDTPDECLTFILEGEVNISFTFTELDNGDIQVLMEVHDYNDLTGDIRGLFFDIGDESLLDGLSVTGDDVTGQKFDADNVTSMGGGNNIHGQGANEAGAYDGGISFGTPGMGDDDIQSTTFVISHDEQALTLEDFAEMDIAVRLTSVGEEDGDREDSLKIYGETTKFVCLEDQEKEQSDGDADDGAADTILPLVDLPEDGYPEGEEEDDPLVFI